MLIIKIEANDNKQHLIQSQSHRQKCWIDGYVEVPKEIESEVIASNGYCDLFIEDGVLKDFVSRPDLMPTEKYTVVKPTETERLRADIEFIALMTGVEL